MTTTATRPQVPFFDYPHVFTSKESELIELIKDVGRRGAFILQADLENFELGLQTYTQAKHALGVANGTDALILALRAAGIGPGDEVIFCTHTYVATAAAIHFVGATPIPVDCGPDHMMAPAMVAAAVTSNTRAIMPTQLNGRTCDMDALQVIADEYQLLIIEDAAQALGSRFKGRCAGTFGIAGTISFYPAKTLGCLGDGGAILTSDDDMLDTMYQLRDHGRNQAGEMVSWGLNSRLDNLQAAILNVKLRDYDDDVRRRREVASLYQAHLEHVIELVLPPAPESESDPFDVYHNDAIEAASRDELRAFLKDNGIGTRVQWGGQLVHQFPALGFQVSLPFAENMMSRALMLPMNTSVSDDDVIYVCEMIRKFYGS